MIDTQSESPGTLNLTSLPRYVDDAINYQFENHKIVAKYEWNVFHSHETICLLLFRTNHNWRMLLSVFVSKRENGKQNRIFFKVFFSRTKTLATHCHMNCFNAIAFSSEYYQNRIITYLICKIKKKEKEKETYDKIESKLQIYTPRDVNWPLFVYIYCLYCIQKRISCQSICMD